MRENASVANLVLRSSQSSRLKMAASLSAILDLPQEHLRVEVLIIPIRLITL